MWLKRHKTLAMAVGVALAAVALFFIAAIPIYQNASVLLGKIKTKSAELESLTTKVSILSKLDPNVLKERVSVLDSALPPRKDVLLYLTSINGLSNELGLTFGGLSLAPGDVTESSASAKTASKSVGLQSLETEIKMSGGEQSIYSFLRTIESVLPLMQIKNIKVSILSGDQFSLSLTLGMLWAEPAIADVKGPVTLFGTEEDKYFTQLSEYRRFEPVLLPAGSESFKSDLFAPFSSAVVLPVETPRPSPTSPVVTVPEVLIVEPGVQGEDPAVQPSEPIEP